jgi:hypothetical protein
VNTKMKHRGWLGCLAGLGLLLTTVQGCQTWVPSAGLTLPTASYLNHLPQYTPDSPFFPLPHELQSMQNIEALPAPVGAEVLPPPLP